MSLVREQRHQEPLILSSPPPLYHRNTAFSIIGDLSPSSFSSSLTSPDSSPVETLNELEKLTFFKDKEAAEQSTKPVTEEPKRSTR
ncbi:Mitogen-activated protein kinase kinase 10 [Cardamine amara subsp. amara]|uniref:Mitogen-activated protein kinase kinase 10 n=1 Tax=Cardamine amara subsp. amara TaxID=228776 RepID=A0ABD0ZMV5_CARAN